MEYWVNEHMNNIQCGEHKIFAAHSHSTSGMNIHLNKLQHKLVIDFVHLFEIT